MQKNGMTLGQIGDLVSKRMSPEQTAAMVKAGADTVKQFMGVQSGMKKGGMAMKGKTQNTKMPQIPKGKQIPMAKGGMTKKKGC